MVLSNIAREMRVTSSRGALLRGATGDHCHRGLVALRLVVRWWGVVQLLFSRLLRSAHIARGQSVHLWLPVSDTR